MNSESERPSTKLVAEVGAGKTAQRQQPPLGRGGAEGLHLCCKGWPILSRQVLYAIVEFCAVFFVVEHLGILCGSKVAQQLTTESIKIHFK